MFIRHIFFESDIGMIVPEDYFMGQSYRDLIAWQKAMDFVMDVYRTTKAFRGTNPMRWPASSGERRLRVPTNIAEGQARFSPNEFHFFLARARDRWSKSKPS